MEAVDTTERPDPVPRAARFTAVLAVLCAAPVVLWVVLIDAWTMGGPLVLGAVTTAVPLFAREAANFWTGCVIIGWILFAVSVLGCIFGLFLLMPASIVLLAAATQADPQAPRLPMYVGIVITAATLGFVCWAFGQG
ncbi:hypothetical protein ACFYS8_18030 [Kitasatospora sp. NPDC004615]|uniref:hypothetical protein n=1 Tax=Kitasatospora sp. NPDC004615 TaxID=3364017 RepID=UPI0036A17FB5